MQESAKIDTVHTRLMQAILACPMSPGLITLHEDLVTRGENSSYTSTEYLSETSVSKSFYTTIRLQLMAMVATSGLRNLVSKARVPGASTEAAHPTALQVNCK